MTPKIDAIGVPASALPTAPGKSSAASPPASSLQASPPQDSVQLTADARLIQSAQAAVSQAPDTDARRIADLKSAISEGRYSVNPERIAGGLMRSQLELASP